MVMKVVGCSVGGGAGRPSTRNPPSMLMFGASSGTPTRATA
jgi:hypothetical protein